MSKYLLVWETGANLGHLSLLLTLATALRYRNHKVTMVLQQSNELHRLCANHNFPCMAAPQLIPSSVLDRELLSYADILLKLGYDQPILLHKTICAWRAIYAREKPDVVILNAAPTATLAARGMKFKTVSYGSSFDLPPLTSPLPPFRNWINAPTQQLLKIEIAVLNSINYVMDRLEQARLVNLTDLFQTDARMLCAMKELDHYPNRQSEKYWGWASNTDSGSDFQWKGKTKYRVFTYLRMNDAMLRNLCGKMNDPDCEYVLFAAGSSSTICEQLSTDNLTVVNQPIKIDDVVENCTLLICHSGLGMITSFLSKGVPLLLLPSQIEQLLASKRVVEHGYGLMCNFNDPQLDIAAPISALLRNSTYRKNAIEFEKKYGKIHGQQFISEIADHISAVDVVPKLNERF